jgi:N-acetylmuramoyl-L-alanine amidase
MFRPDQLKYLLFVFLFSAQNAVLGQSGTASQRWVRTTGNLPFIEFGPGDDRLGGAKMGYLDSNVLLKVTDSLKGDYIVQLSRYHKAFISRENVRFVENKKQEDFNLSGNWLVSGDEKYDHVKISLPERLPYRSQMQLNPGRIILDIFGVTSNTNWVTQLKSAKEIKNAWYEQLEDDVLRVHIELRNGNHWGYRVFYDSTGSKLILKIKRPPASRDIRKILIAVDAGHGGKNTGAAGIRSGILEKDYTLLIAKELEKQLRVMGNRKVIMTRTTDTTLDMPQRIMMLREADPDLLLSIHLNSASRDTISGTSTFYRHIGFRPLSQAILDRMLELGLKEYGNVGHFNFALSGPTEYPNCLVEVAFLSNPDDEKRILDKRFHRDVAKKIINGTKDWLKTMK